MHLLERALQAADRGAAAAAAREIEPNPPSVLERMTEILELLRDTWSLLFSSLAGGERPAPEWW